MKYSLIFLFCIISLTAKIELQAQSKKDTTIHKLNKDFILNIKKAKSLIVIDGIIDEPDW